MIPARFIPLFHLFGVCLSSVRHLLSPSLWNVVMQPVLKPQWRDQTNSVQLLMNADKATDAADGGGLMYRVLVPLLKLQIIVAVMFYDCISLFFKESKSFFFTIKVFLLLFNPQHLSL